MVRLRGRGWAILAAFLWMAAALAFAVPYVLPANLAAVAAGALLGVLAGRRLAATRLRAWLFPPAALTVGALALLAELLLTRWAWPSRLAGARLAYGIAEGLPALLWPLAGTACLEALARRHPAWRAASLAVLGLVFATLFAPHREGFLDRPYGLVDPILGHGHDPLSFFLLLGLGLALLLLLGLAAAGRGRRPLLGVGTLAALLALLFLALPQRRLKTITELHRTLGGQQPDQGGKASHGPRGSGSPAQGRASSQEDKDSPVPDSFTDQSEQPSDAPVAVVVFHGDYQPPLGYYYFRETAFSSYNGIRVVQDPGGRFDRDVATDFGPGDTRVAQGPPPGPLFQPLRTTVALMAPHAHPFGLVDPIRFHPAGNPDPRRFFRAYDVASEVLAKLPEHLVDEAAGGADWDAATWAHYTEAPTDPRYAALVDRILAGLPEALRDKPFARALTIKFWLDRHGTYTLRSGHGDEPDPVGSFLFGDLRGHCVFFAHAACLLYRTAGVPARVAGGYAVPASFRFGGASLLLRSMNAHAWPEIYLRDTGWMPLDISPSKSEAQPEAPPDPQLQQMLGHVAMSQKPPPVPPPTAEPRRFPLGALLRRLLRVLVAAFLALLVLALPAAYLVRVWRRWIPRICRPEAVGRLAYRAALDLLAGAGLRRAFGESREAFAARVGPGSPAFADLTDLHLRRTLGGPGRDPEAARGRALLRQVAADLRHSTPAGRRFRALLDPVPWLRAR
jgi:transglutaminase-like putative cysteine protease